jgi:hypothetical protein
VRSAPVVYLSEEGAGTLAHKLTPAPIRVLTRDVWPKPGWPELIGAAVAEAERIGAALLVVDALSFWSSLAEGQARDAGAMQAVMDAPGAATRAGLAVLLVHHVRKGGGDGGEAVRDSSAIVGAADVVVEMERGEDSPPNERRLVAMSRWPWTPSVLVVDRDPATATWRVIGEAEDRGQAAGLHWCERLLEALPGDEPGVTEAELGRVLGADKRKFGEPLRTLVGGSRLERGGRGVPGDPYRYWKCPGEVSPPRDTSGEREVSDPIGRTLPLTETVPVPGTLRAGETCDDPEACNVPTVPTAHGWRCERCDRYVPPEPGRARQRRREEPS